MKLPKDIKSEGNIMADQLTENQNTNLEDAFCVFDSDGDGKINVKE